MTRNITVNRVYLHQKDEPGPVDFGGSLHNIRLDMLESKARVRPDVLMSENIEILNSVSTPAVTTAPAITTAVNTLDMPSFNPPTPPMFKRHYDVKTNPSPVASPVKPTSSMPSPMKKESPKVEEMFEETNTNPFSDDEGDPAVFTPTPKKEEDEWRTTSPPMFTPTPKKIESSQPTPVNTPVETPKGTPMGTPMRVPTPVQYDTPVRTITPKVSAEPPRAPPRPATPVPIKTPEQIERENVTKWRWTHYLLKQRWPDAQLSHVSDYMDSNTLKELYYDDMRKLVLQNNVDSYRDYLLMFSAAVEYGSMFVFGTNMFEGLTKFHLKSMHKYHHLLVEMGESQDTMFGASIPPMGRLLIYVSFQTMLFGLAKVMASKGGDKLKGMLSMFTGDLGSSSPVAPKEPEAPSAEVREKVKRGGKIPPPMSLDQIRKLKKNSE